jgi:protein-tyrosine kinase
MTIIETALRQLKAKAASEAAAKPTPVSRPGRRPVVDIESPTVAPVSYRPASLDPVTMERNCILPQVVDDDALRAYKILRTRLLQKLSASKSQTLAITSTQPQQGKTLTAINLAMTLAQDVATSVFLVDLDLQRPRVAHSLGMSFEHGISDYLAGKVEADQIIYESGLPRLAIIPNAQALQNSSELLCSPRMQDLMSELVNTEPGRIVIYDMPPLMLADDLLVFAPNVDGVLLVASEGTTTRASLESAKEVLGEMKVLGVVLNRSAERGDSYYD